MAEGWLAYSPELHYREPCAAAMWFSLVCKRKRSRRGKKKKPTQPLRRNPPRSCPVLNSEMMDDYGPSALSEQDRFMSYTDS